MVGQARLLSYQQTFLSILMPAISQPALTIHLRVGLAERVQPMLEATKGREMDQTENRGKRRKGDRRRKVLLKISRAGVTLRCKHREKTLLQPRSFTTGLAQGGIEEKVAGKSSLGRAEAEGRGVKAGRSFQKSGE